MTGRPRQPDEARLARLNEAAEAYLSAQTKAELLVAQAEEHLIAVIRESRRSPGAITWERIGAALGVTRQAAMQKWNGQRR